MKHNDRHWGRAWLEAIHQEEKNQPWMRELVVTNDQARELVCRAFTYNEESE